MPSFMNPPPLGYRWELDEPALRARIDDGRTDPRVLDSMMAAILAMPLGQVASAYITTVPFLIEEEPG